MVRRLTEDTINQELMRLGLTNTAMIKAPSVVASGGGSSSDKDLVANNSDKDLVALVVGTCAATVALLLFVCVCCYCWKKKDRTDQSQQVEMQQGTGNMNPPAPAGIVLPAVLGCGTGVPERAAVGGPRGHGGVGYNV
jgi:hypothetical protein